MTKTWSLAMVVGIIENNNDEKCRHIFLLISIVIWMRRYNKEHIARWSISRASLEKALVRDHTNNRAGIGRAQYPKCHHVLRVQFRYRTIRTTVLELAELSTGNATMCSTCSSGAGP